MGARLVSQFGQKALGSESLTIGSENDNQLVLYDPQADSHHAEIRQQGSTYAIMDRGSASGTFINGQRLTPNLPRLLNPGDTIRIGTIDFTYQMDDMTLTAQSEPFPQPAMFSPDPANNPLRPQFSASNYLPPTGKRGGISRSLLALIIVVVVLGLGGGILVYALSNSAGSATPTPTVNHAATSTAISRGSTAVVAATTTALVSSAGADPQTALLLYCAALKSGDAHGAYQALSSSAQKSISEPVFTAALGLAATKGGIKSCTVSNVQTHGSTASATVTITPNNGKAISENETLVKENGIWKLNLKNPNF